jgi:hypothetical protein
MPNGDEYSNLWPEQYIGMPLISSHSYHLTTEQALVHGRNQRDHQVWKYPILPGAIKAFQDIAGGRSWTVGGKPEAVMKVLELLHGAQSKNLITGHIQYGFETYLRRRALDSLAVGQTSMAMRHPRSGSDAILEYVDPTMAKQYRKNQVKTTSAAHMDSSVTPPAPSSKNWRYDGRWYRNDEMFINHQVPIGANSFIAPLTWITPICELAWLIHEHHRASVDGRKIRSLLFVPKAWKDDIKDEMQKMIALFTGEVDPSKAGVPVVGYGGTNSLPVEDLIFMLELSKLGANFDEENFFFTYVNSISGATGVSIRHFWNDERGSNRALELVQVQREQIKGPAAFIRTEERMINNSGILERATGDSEVRMNFVEEVDTSTMKAKAEVIDLYSKAVKALKEVFNVTFSLESFLAWLQRDAGVPLDIVLEDGGEPVNEAVEDGAQLLLENEIGRLGDESSVIIEGKSVADIVDMGFGSNIMKRARPGEIVVDQEGNIIDTHRKYYKSVYFYNEDIKNKRLAREEAYRKAIQLEIKKSLEDEEVTEPVQQTFDRLTQERIYEQWTVESKNAEFTADLNNLNDHIKIYNKLYTGMWISDDEVKLMDGALTKWFDKKAK